MRSGNRLHTATLLLGTRLATGSFFFDDISEQMAEHDILRLGKESRPVKENEANVKFSNEASRRHSKHTRCC